MSSAHEVVLVYVAENPTVCYIFVKFKCGNIMWLSS